MLPAFRQNGDNSGDNTESVSCACLLAANLTQKEIMLQDITFCLLLKAHLKNMKILADLFAFHPLFALCEGAP